MINLRMNRLIYPDWITLVQLDRATYEAHKDIFDSIPKTNFDYQINDDADLCEGMLWRMKPIFDGKWTHVLCRDLDSPTTYREAQAVRFWMNRGKAVHAITDSVSHNLPMLGGMVGFMCGAFREHTGWKTWRDMKNHFPDLKTKGSDQHFLNTVVYPIFARHGSDSITQHYIKGMPNTFLSDCHADIQPMELSIPVALKESNDVCGHIGAAGWYETALFKFLRKHWNRFDDLLAIEEKHPDIFYWVNE
jgi:hypothetical protein